ncbi:acetolactate synthase small subunit [Oscillospiraceae bacterium HV4-5-C5C]|nr:acetolactate synthase small subunit [Oscillospiraceae bacterium HV4-5-C5C]
MLSIIAVMVENRAGVLSRVSNLFARRGFNISSLAVGETQNPEISRITLSLDVSAEELAQMVKQLYKLPDVLIVRNLTHERYCAREFVFFKVSCVASQRGEVINLINIFRGHIVDVSADSLTFEVSGAEEKIAALQQLLNEYGILELVRTGQIAIERGSSSFSAPLKEDSHTEEVSE